MIRSSSFDNALLTSPSVDLRGEPRPSVSSPLSRVFRRLFNRVRSEFYVLLRLGLAYVLSSFLLLLTDGNQIHQD